MKVGDLVFANGAIAIIVGDCYTSRDLGSPNYVRLYYFGSRRFADNYKWSIVPI